jgi:hypothetical protein
MPIGKWYDPIVKKQKGLGYIAHGYNFSYSGSENQDNHWGQPRKKVNENSI